MNYGSIFSKSLLAICVAGSLTACGGDGGISTAGISGTGITSGPITGFGSIFVNGIRFNIDTADISVDEVRNKTQGDLRIGMQVIVRGGVNGTSGIAVSVEFDKNIEGPVTILSDDGSTKTFTIFGTQITANKTSTIFEDGSYASLVDGNVVEVSGLADASGNITASFIEKESETFVPNDTEVEISGIVSNVVGSGSVGDSFEINGITINIAVDAEFEDLPGNRVSNGDFVEVEGVLENATTIRATEIEKEDESYGEEGDEINLNGIVSGFTDINSTFKVGLQTVDASSAELFPASLQLTNGLEVEVEGELSGGILFAEEIESREDEISISAEILQVKSSSVVLTLGDGTVEVTIDNQTQLEDNFLDRDNLSISDLNAGDFLSLEGLQNGDQIIATEAARIDPAESVVLAGPVESVDANTSITILGITFFVNGGTDYQNTTQSFVTSNSVIGSVVEIKDENKNGFADEVEIDD
jgi:cytochrome c-type biogenesis protein CcmE